MKNATLLVIGILFSTITFAQKTKQSKEIYFEGTIKQESMWDGIFSFDVKITKGPLAGKTESFYMSTVMDDPKQVECKGCEKIDGTGSSSGKRVKGKIIESTGKFEDYKVGGYKIKKCYRPIEINFF
jgi:hypothetical protein